MNRVKRKYVKQILRLDSRTPNYVLTEETKMIKLRIEALRRAIKYKKSKKIREDSSRVHKRFRERKKEKRRKQIRENKERIIKKNKNEERRNA